MQETINYLTVIYGHVVNIEIFDCEIDFIEDQIKEEEKYARKKS